MTTPNAAQQEALARQIIRRMHRDPDERVTVDGESVPLWKIAWRVMDKMPVSARTALDAIGQRKRRPWRAVLTSWWVKITGQSDGWIDPAVNLPDRSEADLALSEVVLIKREGKVQPAVLLFGSPVGSHRWIINMDQPNEYYVHVLDIYGWREINLYSDDVRNS